MAGGVSVAGFPLPGVRVCVFMGGGFKARGFRVQGGTHGLGFRFVRLKRGVRNLYSYL